MRIENYTHLRKSRDIKKGSEIIPNLFYNSQFSILNLLYGEVEGFEVFV